MEVKFYFEKTSSIEDLATVRELILTWDKTFGKRYEITTFTIICSETTDKQVIAYNREVRGGVG